MNSTYALASLCTACSDPLYGRNEFNKTAGGELASVRAPIIDASILFYPVLYFYHEADAAWNSLKRADMGINAAANVEAARGESTALMHVNMCTLCVLAVHQQCINTAPEGDNHSA